MQHLFYITGIAISLISCCKAAAPELEIVVEDQNGTNLLTGVTPSDSTWSWYSSNTFGNQLTEIVSTSEGLAFTIDAYLYQSGDTAFIYSNPNDLDTLIINYELKGGSCNKQVKASRIEFNGDVFKASGKGDPIKVIKH